MKKLSILFVAALFALPLALKADDSQPINGTSSSMDTQTQTTPKKVSTHKQHKHNKHGKKSKPKPNPTTDSTTGSTDEMGGVNNNPPASNEVK